MAGSGKGAVFMALIGNGFLTVIKFVAFLLTGSGALLSEAIHSGADCANQALLYVGVKRSQRPADDTYQYGYGGDRFFYALMSAVGIFVLGAGVTIYHGVEHLIYPPELEISPIAFIVLAIALVVDGVVLVAAVREVNRRRGEQSFREFVRTSTDPTLLAVLFEDGIATLGVLIAAAGIGLAWLTGNTIFDALSSIAIGGLLGLMAIWLGWRNRVLLLGPSIPEGMQKQIVDFIEEQPSVDAIRLVRTRIVGAEKFRVAVELDYNGRYLGELDLPWFEEQAAAGLLDTPEGRKQVIGELGHRLSEALGDEVDRLEAALSERFPRIKHIDLEVD
ncbi:MAG: cation diffusion facilitator family transporter [Deltaproteobacteria bacterium]|nr:cation diffusion facilitator family transporter [Deltaproteobacteria bacterium]